MSAQAFIRSMIQSLTEDAAKLAADITSRGASHEDYLITVGKYRQIQAIVAKLRERLAKADAPAEDGFDELPEPDPQPAPQQRPVTRKNSTPRPWGGGR